MENFTYSALLQSIVTLVLVVITGFLIPFLKQKYGIDKFEKAYGWTVIAVNAAEQIFNATGMGKEKYKYVSDFLISKGFDLTEDEVEALIESIVRDINAAALAAPVAKDVQTTMEEILTELKAPTVTE